MKKILLLGILVGLLFIIACQKEQQPIGGQTDEHGCLTPAGYSWNEEVSACMREWELDESQKEAAMVAVAPLSYRTTILNVETYRCPGCFGVYLKRNDNGEDFVVSIIENKISETKNWNSEEYYCDTDEDCVPAPGCHPHECMNQESAALYDQPEACTLMFDSMAAYSKEDCVCIENKCNNKNRLEE